MSGRAGLCESCEHRRIVESERGGRFYLCRLSESDPSFPRYPRLPVLACAGYEVNPSIPQGQRIDVTED